MPWAALVWSEYRRVRKWALDVGRRQPIALAAVAALPVGLFALAARAGELLAVAVILPGGLAAVNLFILGAGVVIGFALTMAAPRLSNFDEQFRLLPVSAFHVFLGMRALPFLVIVALMAIMASVLAWRMYGVIAAHRAEYWAALFALLFISAATQGAAASESLRGRRSWPLLAAGAAALACALGYSVAFSLTADSAWVWLAGYLPTASLSSAGDILHSTPPAPAAAMGALATLLLSGFSWVMFSLRPDPATQARMVSFSLPMGNNVVQAFVAWATLTTLRLGPARNRILLAALAGLAAAPLLTAAAPDVSFLALFLAFGLFALVAEVGLMLAEERSNGSWLIKSAPTSTWSRAIAWWISVFVIVLAAGSVAVALPMLGLTDTTVMEVTALGALFACSVSVVGLILPWNRTSLAQQVAASACVTIGAGIGLAARAEIAARLEGPLGQGAPFLAVGAVMLVSLALCVAIEALDS